MDDGRAAYGTGGEAMILAMSIELAGQKWKVALHDGRRDHPAIVAVSQTQASDQAVVELVKQYKTQWSLPATTTRRGEL